MPGSAWLTIQASCAATVQFTAISHKFVIEFKVVSTTISGMPVKGMLAVVVTVETALARPTVAVRSFAIAKQAVPMITAFNNVRILLAAAMAVSATFIIMIHVRAVLCRGVSMMRVIAAVTV
jgi:hypothetical protein